MEKQGGKVGSKSVKNVFWKMHPHFILPREVHELSTTAKSERLSILGWSYDIVLVLFMLKILRFF